MDLWSEGILKCTSRHVSPMGIHSSEVELLGSQASDGSELSQSIHPAVQILNADGGPGMLGILSTLKVRDA